MLQNAVRGVVVGAWELVEEAGKRVRGPAEELLARTGVDVAEVERRIAEQLPPTPRSLQRLAGDAVTYGRAEIDRTVEALRGEAERAMGAAWGEVERVFELVGDQVTKVGVVLAFLESKLREVEEERPSAERTEGRAEGLFDAGWEKEHEAAAPRKTAAVKATAPKPAARKTAAKKTTAQKATAQEATARKATAQKATAQKATAKKATAKKTVARKTTASGGTAKRAVAKKAVTKKTVVRKTATAKPAAREDTDG